MSRRLVLGVIAAVLALAAELALGLAGRWGHWPVGTGVTTGVLGALALALGAKALGAAGLQEPDRGDGADPGGVR